MHPNSWAPAALARSNGWPNCGTEQNPFHKGAPFRRGTKSIQLAAWKRQALLSGSQLRGADALLPADNDMARATKKALQEVATIGLPSRSFSGAAHAMPSLYASRKRR